jgi:membrane-associated phospholipid phosphatase
VNPPGRFGFLFSATLLTFLPVSGSLKSRRILWLAAGLALIAVAWLVEGPVDAALDASGQPKLHQIAWWFSKFGEGDVIGAVGIVFAAIFFLLHRPRLAADLFFITLTSELTGLAATILRVLFGRTRPTNHLVPQGFYGLWHDGHWIAGKYQFSSFPSGHSASAVGLAAAVWLVHRGWGGVAAVYALAVMWSRIALECHHLSDVIASTVLAIPLAIMLKKTLAPFVEAQFDNWHRARQTKS